MCRKIASYEKSAHGPLPTCRILNLWCRYMSSTSSTKSPLQYVYIVCPHVHVYSLVYTEGSCQCTLVISSHLKVRSKLFETNDEYHWHMIDQQQGEIFPQHLNKLDEPWQRWLCQGRRVWSLPYKTDNWEWISLDQVKLPIIQITQQTSMTYTNWSV